MREMEQNSLSKKTASPMHYNYSNQRLTNSLIPAMPNYLFRSVYKSLTVYCSMCSLSSFLQLLFYHNFRMAGLALWWEHLPSTNVARVQFPGSASNVDWVCWFSTLLWEVFPRVLRFSPLTKNQHLIWFDLICRKHLWIAIWAMLIWFPLEL